MLHRNAKTTPHMRALLVDRIRVQHWRPAAAAVAAGVSVRTAYKWLARYRFAGRAGLEDRSSAPARQPRRTPPERIAEIVAARQARCLGGNGLELVSTSGMGSSAGAAVTRGTLADQADRPLGVCDRPSSRV
jgi:transposase